MPRRGDSALYAISPDQVQAALKACSELNDRVVIGLQIFAGLRANEVAHFRASWTTPDSTIQIPMRQDCDCYHCTTNKRHPREWHCKTKQSARTIPIATIIRGDLERFCKAQPDGLHMSRIAIWKRTKDILKRAGIRQKGLARDTGFPHALRATCATMLAAHLTSAELCYIMGWKKLAVGEHYIQIATLKPSAIQHMRQAFG